MENQRILTSPPAPFKMGWMGMALGLLQNENCCLILTAERRMVRI